MKLKYDEMMRISKEFYDTVDFMKFISECYGEISVRDLMNCVEEYYDYHNENLIPEEFQGCFFNFMNEDEFSEYLKDRYGFQVRHEVIERYYISKK